MEIEDIQDQADADQYWLEHGPPTAVERHMAIRTAERGLIRTVLAGLDHQNAATLLRRLMAEETSELPK